MGKGVGRGLVAERSIFLVKDDDERDGKKEIESETYSEGRIKHL